MHLSSSTSHADHAAVLAARLSVVSAARSIAAVARSERIAFVLVGGATIWGMTTSVGQGLIVVGAASIPWMLRRDAMWLYRARFHGCAAPRLLQLQGTALAIVVAAAVGLGRVSLRDGVFTGATLLLNAWIASVLPLTINHSAPDAVLRRRSIPFLSPFYLSILRQHWVALLGTIAVALALSHLPAVVIAAIVWSVLVFTRDIMTRPADDLLEAANGDGRRSPIAHDVFLALAMLGALALPLALALLFRSREADVALAAASVWAVSCVILSVLARRRVPGMAAELLHFLIVVLALVPPVAAWLGMRLWMTRTRQET